MFVLILFSTRNVTKIKGVSSRTLSWSYVLRLLDAPPTRVLRPRSVSYLCSTSFPRQGYSTRGPNDGPGGPSYVSCVLLAGRFPVPLDSERSACG